MTELALNYRERPFFTYTLLFVLVIFLFSSRCIIGTEKAMAETETVSHLDKSVVAAMKNPPNEKYPLRWVYCSVNFQVNDRVDGLIEIMNRAREIGYNGIVITDYKFGRIKERPETYYHNLQRVQQAAEELDIEIIPVIMSPSILINNPSMVEGIPVKDCLLIVEDGKGMVKNKANLLSGGGFERLNEGNSFEGWDWIDGPGKSTFRDTEVKYSGDSAIRMAKFREGNEYSNCRIHKKLTLKPWTQYHVRVFIKTENVASANQVKIAVLAADNRSLNHRDLAVKKTQNWTEYNITFNTLEHTYISRVLHRNLGR
jgi:hypothetical protein